MTETKRIVVQDRKESDDGNAIFINYKLGDPCVCRIPSLFEALAFGANVDVSGEKAKSKAGKEYFNITDVAGANTGQEVKVKEVQTTQPPTKPEVEETYREAKIRTTEGKAKSSAMSKDDWDAKDKRTRKSIERQTALNNAVELVKLLKPAEHLTKITIDTAKVFEKYIETGE